VVPLGHIEKECGVWLVWDNWHGRAAAAAAAAAATTLEQSSNQ